MHVRARVCVCVRVVLASLTVIFLLCVWVCVLGIFCEWVCVVLNLLLPLSLFFLYICIYIYTHVYVCLCVCIYICVCVSSSDAFIWEHVWHKVFLIGNIWDFNLLVFVVWMVFNYLCLFCIYIYMCVCVCVCVFVSDCVWVRFMFYLTLV